MELITKGDSIFTCVCWLVCLLTVFFVGLLFVFLMACLLVCHFVDLLVVWFVVFCWLLVDVFVGWLDDWLFSVG